MHINELAPDMDHTGHLRSFVVPKQCFEARITISMDPAFVAAQVSLRVFAVAIYGEPVPGQCLLDQRSTTDGTAADDHNTSRPVHERVDLPQDARAQWAWMVTAIERLSRSRSTINVAGGSGSQRNVLAHTQALR